MKIYYRPKFERQYKKLPAGIQELANEKTRIFSKDPFDARLKTHKLQGTFRGLWSFSIDYKYRIIFEFTDDIAVFYYIGGHDIYE